jgi:capsid protein
MHIPLSADSEILQDLSLVRFRSRYMYYNNELATSIINNIHQYESDYKINSLIEDEKLKSFIVDKFQDWKEHAQHGNKTFDEFVDLYKYTMLMDGECFIKVFDFNDNSECQLSLQVIDSDRIMTPTELTDPKHNVRSGIKYDTLGVATGAYVLNYHPNDEFADPWLTNYDTSNPYTGTSRTAYKLADFTFYPYTNEDGTPNLLHIFKQVRPNQSRGVPILSPVMRTLHCLFKFTDATLIRQIMVASVGLAVTSIDPQSNAEAARFDTVISDLYNGDTTSGTALAEQESIISWLWSYVKKTAEPWKAGQIKYMKTGEDIKAIDMGGPTTDIYKNFVVHNITQVASALKVPPFIIYGDWGAINYSSARAALNGFKSTLESNQKFDIDKVIKPLYKLFIQKTAEDNKDLQQYELKQLQKFTVTPKRIAHVDPDAEMSAVISGINAGLLTYSEILSVEGKDFAEHFNRIAYEQQHIKKLNINLKDSNIPEATPVEIPSPSLVPATL